MKRSSSSEPRKNQTVQEKTTPHPTRSDSKPSRKRTKLTISNPSATMIEDPPEEDHEQDSMMSHESYHYPSFDWIQAQDHLKSIDVRFSILFGRLNCGPFDHHPIIITTTTTHDSCSSDPIHRSSSNSTYDSIQSNHPFRNLSSSILAQQVSGSAARSITYKFIKLFYPHLPEKLDPSIKLASLPFPRPHQVIDQSIDRLRSAGISQPKAHYLLDLSHRFADRRLDPRALLRMHPKRVMDELSAVRGIGPWTVEMFLIFCARHPDILPHADLAIQKGILKWYTTSPSIEQLEKLSSSNDDHPGRMTPNSIISTTKTMTMTTGEDTRQGSQASSLRSDPLPLPLPLPLPPIPAGCSLSRAQLISRLTKPLKPGRYLSPSEMDQLSQPWKPYRSIPVCYFWSLTGLIPE